MSKDRTAEIDAMIAEQDERSRRREAEHIERLLDALTDLEMARLAPTRDEIAHRLGYLYRWLRNLDLLPEDDDEEEIEARVKPDPATGEIIVGLEIDGVMYALAGVDGDGGPLMARREHGGRSQYAVVDDDGEPIEPWIDVMAGPPAGREKLN